MNPIRYKAPIKNLNYAGFDFEVGKNYMAWKKSEQYTNIKTKTGTIIWMRTEFFNSYFK